MDISVLGPFAVTYQGISVVPTATKPRKVLAMLALHANELMPVSALMEELWDDNPPRSATTTLQTYILQLRNLVATAIRRVPDGPAGSAKDVLVTTGGGYLLATGAGSTDVREFDRLCVAGRQAMAAGDHPTASATFRRALSLWRGPALVDVDKGRLLEPGARYLDEARLSVVSQRIEADLTAGRHYEILGELAGLCLEHPLDENLQAHYMLALARAGRRYTALEVYRRLRGRIKSQLGIEPSPVVRELQQSILAGGAGVDFESAFIESVGYGWELPTAD